MRKFNQVSTKSKHYLKQTLQIAELSKDPSTKVGALIIGLRGEVVSQGRNGFPIGTNDKAITRDRKLLRTIHAELNAVLFAQRSLIDHSIYISAPPCASCMAAIIQVGISKVICFVPEKEFEGRWKESCDEATILAQEVEIAYIQVEK